jgi:hypothetical protein
MNWRKLSLIAMAVAVIFSTGSIVARRFIRHERSTVLMSGRFHRVAHRGAGMAIITQLPDGQRRLDLREFSTGAGADLAVYLIAAPDAFENETIERSEFVPLGTLQSSQGDQSYSVPADLDLNKFRAVTIWNRKYRVNYTTAPLKRY